MILYNESGNKVQFDDQISLIIFPEGSMSFYRNSSPLSTKTGEREFVCILDSTSNFSVLMMFIGQLTELHAHIWRIGRTNLEQRIPWEQSMKAIQNALKHQEKIYIRFT